MLIPGELHGPVVFRGLGDAMRGGLHLFHPVFGCWDFLCRPRDGILEPDELSAIRQLDRFVEAPFPVRGHQANSSAPAWVNFT